MNRRVGIVLHSVCALAGGSLFFHWGCSTLSNINPPDWTWYNRSFFWLFENFWRIFGIEPFDRSTNIDMIGNLSAYGLRFLSTLISIALFLALAHLGTKGRFALGGLAALLCSIGYFVLSMPADYILRELLRVNYTWVEFAVLAQSFAICAYVTAPKRFWALEQLRSK